MKGKIVIDKERCKGCYYCFEACPQKLIDKADSFNQSEYYPASFSDPEEKCTGCALCAIVCPDLAIEVFKEEKDE